MKNKINMGAVRATLILAVTVVLCQQANAYGWYPNPGFYHHHDHFHHHGGHHQHHHGGWGGDGYVYERPREKFRYPFEKEKRKSIEFIHNWTLQGCINYP